ncbi:MAG: trypsin-like peptidase domain-containing protein [Proteobacteria bacterium]|nr:trypsin-like peptidase domain-containing protein [Pseudomonadota bacterium]
MRPNVRRLACAAIAACALGQALLPPPAARANVFSPDGADPRHVQARVDQPFDAIGVVDTDDAVPLQGDDDHLTYERMEATAFLVSPCYVLTNFHAVFGDDAARVDRRKRYGVTFKVGARNNGRGFAARAHGVPLFWGDMARNHEQADWAVVRLDHCLGADRRIGWLDLSPRPITAFSSQLVSVAGFPAGMDENHLWRADGCHLLARQGEPSLWSSDCAASPGASGSPVFLMENGAPKVVGLMEGAEEDRPDILRQFDPQLANLVVDIAAVVGDAKVMAALDADRRADHTEPSA